MCWFLWDEVMGYQGCILALGTGIQPDQKADGALGRTSVCGGVRRGLGLGLLHSLALI
jgi:hypothetical protein